MAFEVSARLFTDEGVAYADGVDSLRGLLGAPHNSLLFPPYYMKAAFPKIGGKIVLVESAGEILGVGFLFPRSINNGVKEFTLRYHHARTDAGHIEQELITRAVEEAVPGSRVKYYDPGAAHTYTKRFVEQIELGNGKVIDIYVPGHDEAIQIRLMQEKIWKSAPDDLYPIDIHSVDFQLATSLVAVCEGQPVGFLFGFYRHGGSDLPPAWHSSVKDDLRVESQLLGVIDEYRSLGLGFYLKKVQAGIAAREGIDIINWTVDPLQFTNAVLNFGKLKAVAFNFYRHYYTFNNMLNRVPASRFGITWLAKSKIVGTTLSRPDGNRYNLSSISGEGVQVVNDGAARLNFEADSPKIAIEVPGNWTHLQAAELDTAMLWREATDSLFAHYISPREGKYVITSVGFDGAKRYLIGESITPELAEALRS